MTRLEYEEVLNAFAIKQEEKNSTISWYTTKIDFPKKHYAVVKGIIPEEVKKTIYDRNRNKKDGIMPNGSYENRNPENFYISYYHFELKEGFIFFLAAMYNYFAKSNHLKKISDKREEEILKEIEFSIIQKTNPFQTTEEWMKHTSCYEKYKKVMLESECQEKLRTLLDCFDKSINPFMDRKILLKDADLFLENIHVKGSLTLEEARIILWEKESGHAVYNNRTSNGFNYAVAYKDENNANVSFIHYFHPMNGIDYSNTENITIIKDGINFHYDITTDTMIDIKTNERRKMTGQEKGFLYQELTKAIKEAQKVTIKHMAVEEIARKLHVS